MAKLHVAHILVTHRYEAEDLLRRLNGGESFEKLAQKHSLCPSASRGGDLGPDIEASRLDDDFAQAALELKPAEISGVVRSRFGHHLIKRLK